MKRLFSFVLAVAFGCSFLVATVPVHACPLGKVLRAAKGGVVLVVKGVAKTAAKAPKAARRVAKRVARVRLLPRNR